MSLVLRHRPRDFGLALDEEGFVPLDALVALSPLILTIRARDALAAGVVFHSPEPKRYLAQAIPPEYITFPGAQPNEQKGPRPEE